jgi:hypothetical protein
MDTNRHGFGFAFHPCLFVSIGGFFGRGIAAGASGAGARWNTARLAPARATIVLRSVRRLFGVALLFGTLSASAAIHSRHPAPVVDPSVPVPTITFDQTSFNFGKIPAGQTVVHTFIVMNTGRAPLQLEEVKAVCGCTSTVVGKRSLKPGETTEIQAAYTPEKGFTGAMRKTIMIVCNDPAHAKLTLRLSGTVLPASPAPGA